MLRLLSLFGAVVLLTHCAGAPNPSTSTPMSRSTAPSENRSRRSQGKSEILLDGRIYKVRWGDGDTFRLKTLTGKKKSARLAGFNTLESYGPVHRWGEWTADELYQLANAAGVVAAARRGGPAPSSLAAAAMGGCWWRAPSSSACSWRKA